MTSCDLCLRERPHAWERWDGVRVCDACLAEAVRIAEALVRGRSAAAWLRARAGGVR